MALFLFYRISKTEPDGTDDIDDIGGGYQPFFKPKSTFFHKTF